MSSELELSLDAAFSTIQKGPLGLEIRYDDVRIAFIKRFPFGVHFIIERKNIMVISIYHTSRNPESWFARRKAFWQAAEIQHS
ncbi:MAG: hypothetical protein K1X61_09915 [Chitinophagales bacterium]|nr:hypothetical protein [Chitinophagales bacterium]